MEIIYQDESGQNNCSKQDTKWTFDSKKQKGMGLIESLFFISFLSFLTLSLYQLNLRFHQKKIYITKKTIKQWRHFEKEN